MLTHLQIRNLAVVRNLDTDFSAGMTAITGETGAGKSIALDALGLCLGDRADADLVRAGQSKAEVIAEFELTPTSPALHWLERQELSDENHPHTCIIRRTITQEGRSRAWINGAVATVTQLRELAPFLVNIHGQHEHQLLNRAEYQQRILDAYAGHSQLLQQVTEYYQHWRKLHQQQKQWQQQQEEFAARRELLEYQVQELDEFGLSEGEFEQLDHEFKRAANTAGLKEDAEFALNVLFEVEHNSAHGLVQAALSRLENQLDNDPQLADTVKLLSDAKVQIDEACRDLRHYYDNLDVDPATLAQIEQRVSQAVKLAKKHQVEPALLPQKHQQLSEELAQLSATESDLSTLEQSIQQASQAYRQAAAELSKSRQQAAAKLAKAITASMQQLSMPHGQFAIEVEHHAQQPATAMGTDTIQFLVSANPGQPLQALAKTASGGELSRISLAIQVITANQLTTPTLMFDEVDVGVSGATAATVGKLLRQLGQQAQVICVTHLPQVAACAHQQLQVAKVTDGRSTETSMIALTEAERVLEIARLLGGDKVTESAKANAAELLAHSD